MKTDNYFQKAADKLLEEGQEITVIDDLDKWEITGLDHDERPILIKLRISDSALHSLLSGYQAQPKVDVYYDGHMMVGNHRIDPDCYQSVLATFKGLQDKAQNQNKTEISALYDELYKGEA